jgi:hypothetical protein
MAVRYPVLRRQERVVDRQKERVARMTQVLQSFASGFTLRNVGINLVQSGQAPAFSSSDRIWFHEGMLGDLTTKEGVASIKGLTLHEIGHILLSPRVGNDFRDWVIESGMHRAWNALEDQRIESMLVASYPSTRDWYNATITQYLLTEQEGWSVAFPLIHGRKYLDKGVRRLIRDLYVNQHDVRELSDIIDKFRTLNMSDATDAERAKELVEAYHELTKNVGITNPNGHDVRSNEEGESNVRSRPWNRTKQEQVKEQLESEPYEDLDEIEDPDGCAMGGDDLTPSGQSGTDTNSSDDSNTDDANGENGTPSDASGTQGDASGSQGEGNGKDAGDLALEKELERRLTKQVDEIFERLDDALTKDINLYNGDVLLEGEVLPEPDTYKYTQTRYVSGDVAVGSDQFAYELQRLRAEHDPAWVRRTSNGRLDPVRWERGCEIDEAFDQFKSGNALATDIEAVILLDVSGSMASEEHKAHESMWAIKRALDSVNADTSVITYSDASYTLYSKNERVGNDMKFIGNQGGTNPTKALQYAYGELANSTRAIKLLIIITDGAWDGKCLEPTRKMITELRDGGVLTSLAWLDTYRESINFESVDTHGVEIVSHIRNAGDLFHLGRSIVDVGIQRQLTH